MINLHDGNSLGQTKPKFTSPLTRRFRVYIHDALSLTIFSHYLHRLPDRSLYSETLNWFCTHPIQVFLWIWIHFPLTNITITLPKILLEDLKMQGKRYIMFFTSSRWVTPAPIHFSLIFLIWESFKSDCVFMQTIQNPWPCRKCLVHQIFWPYVLPVY